MLFFFFFSLFTCLYISFFFFFNDTATTEIYTLSLHDALPIYTSLLLFVEMLERSHVVQPVRELDDDDAGVLRDRDRKSTRLNSSHSQISYAVFCLKKKKNKKILTAADVI